VGKMLGPARAAASMLAVDGVDATVWDVRLVKPLDETMLSDAAGHPHVITVEDGYREGGAGAAIADRIATLTGADAGAVSGAEPGADSAPRSRAVAAALRPTVTVLGVPVRFIPHGKPDAILASMGLDADGIAATARGLLEDAS
jgi:1-deoxy-D-xylulose-5-phosphate synthase